MKKIPLTKGHFAIVDDEDFEFLSQTKWQSECQKNTIYAVRSLRRVGDKRLAMRMHRVVLGITEKNVFVDHIDGNGLNNQKRNLRCCTIGDNNKNRSVQKNNNSGFKGVHFRNQKPNWRASIRNEKSRINIGYFDTPEEAARAYNQAAKEFHGKFARFNKVEPMFPPTDLLNKIVPPKMNTAFRGVYLSDNQNGKWRARIRVNRLMINLGYFDTPEDAAIAYNEAAKKHNGDKAKLNEI